MITKHKIESFIVVNDSLAAVANGTRLYNFTTDAINVPVNNFAVFTPVANSGNPVTITAPVISTAPQLQLIKHRNTSGDRNPLGQMPIEKSPLFGTDCLVQVRGSQASAGANNMRLIGDVAATVGAVPVDSLTEYIINVSTHGWRVDQSFGLTTPLKDGRFTTPDYTASIIYTIEAQRRDHILMNIAADYDQKSHDGTLILCIDSAGTAGAADGVVTLTNAIALADGDAIIIGFKDDGTPLKLIMDGDLRRAFTQLIAATSLAGTAEIVAFALPTAANLAVAARNVAGGRAAGTVDAEVDHLVVVSLKSKKAFYDEVPQEDERVEVGLDLGFGGAVSNVLAVAPTPVVGSGEQLLEYYRGTKGYRNYAGGKPYQGNFVEYQSGILAGGLYDVFFIETCTNRVASSGMPSQSPQVTVVAILSTNVSAEFTGFTGAPNPMLAYFQTAINGWMNSTTFPHTNI